MTAVSIFGLLEDLYHIKPEQVDAEIAELERRLQLLRNFRQLLSPNPIVVASDQKPDTPPSSGIYSTDNPIYQRTPISRKGQKAGLTDTEIQAGFQLLDAGKTLPEIAKTLNLRYYKVCWLRKKWETATGKKYLEEAYPHLKTATVAKQEPPASPVTDLPSVSLEVDEKPAAPKDVPFTTLDENQIAEGKARIEMLLRRGPAPYKVILTGTMLTGRQFNELIPFCDIEKTGDFWHLKSQLNPKLDE